MVPEQLCIIATRVTADKNMKQIILTMALCGIMANAAPAQTPPPDQSKPGAIAEALIDALGKEDFNGAGRDFDETMKLKLPPEKIRAVWQSLTGMAGAYKGRLQTRTERSQLGTPVTINCDFEKYPIEARILVSTALRIQSFWCAPATTSLPSYADSRLYTEEPGSFTSQGMELKGTLTIPKGKGPFKAVFMVHGSGPQDRDETMGPNKFFRDIAAGLASQGIAVFRYDKRRAYPGISEADITVKEEVLDDALAAAAFLRADGRIKADGIYVLGHSLGAQFAPRIVQLDGKLAGFIVAAGPVRPFGETILRQSVYLAGLDGAVTEAEKAWIEVLKKQAALAEGPELKETTPAKDLPLGLNPKYLISLNRYKPVKTAAGLQIPMLILQGERDYQVTMDDFRLWEEGLTGRSNAAFKSYPGLNHLFMHGEGPGNPSEYSIPGHVDGTVIKDIADWLK